MNIELGVVRRTRGEYDSYFYHEILHVDVVAVIPLRFVPPQTFKLHFRQKQVKMDCERHLILMRYSKPTPPILLAAAASENCSYSAGVKRDMTLVSILCPSSSTTPNAFLTFDTLLFEVTTPRLKLMRGVMLMLGPVPERQVGMSGDVLCQQLNNANVGNNNGCTLINSST